ncbi:MAG: SPFH domain-containing protein [Planctomycetes bacterium]|nr:SPFH domain-containing protein [Planctomycetota bacterium]
MDILTRRGPITIPVLPIISVLLIAVLALVTMRIGRVQGDQIGVLVNNLTGNVEVRMQSGSFFYNGLVTDFYTLDNTRQILRMAGDNDSDDVDIKTRDGSDVSLEVEIAYRLQQDEATIRTRLLPEVGLAQEPALVQRGPSRRDTVVEEVDAYKARWVRDYARAVIRYVFGELRTDEFYEATARDGKAKEAEQELNRLLQPHGIQVLSVVPDKFRFYEEYEKKISEKNAALQEVQSQKDLARAATQMQKRRETETNATVTAEIAKVEGELRKEMLEAEGDAARDKITADAYAISQKNAAEAAFYKAQNDAKALLAKAQAEAEGMRQLAASLVGEGGLQLVKLEYAKALARSTITGVPYATDPRIQKVEVSGSADPRDAKAAAGAAAGKEARQ